MLFKLFATTDIHIMCYIIYGHNISHSNLLQCLSYVCMYSTYLHTSSLCIIQLQLCLVYVVCPTWVPVYWDDISTVSYASYIHKI